MTTSPSRSPGTTLANTIAARCLTSEQLDAIAIRLDDEWERQRRGARTSTPGLPGRDGSDETAGEPLQQFRGKFGRYLDIDDDGIPYRTIPGTHLSGASPPAARHATNMPSTPRTATPIDATSTASPEMGHGEGACAAAGFYGKCRQRHRRRHSCTALFSSAHRHTPRGSSRTS